MCLFTSGYTVKHTEKPRYILLGDLKKKKLVKVLFKFVLTGKHEKIMNGIEEK